MVTTRIVAAHTEVAHCAVEAHIAREHRDRMRDIRAEVIRRAEAEKRILLNEAGYRAFPPDCQEAHAMYRSAAASYAAKRGALTRAVKKLIELNKS